MTTSTKKGQMAKNIGMNIFAFVVQFVISFYISPKVVSGIGTEAYGFIGLAGDFTSYATILTSIFNAVAARFIAKAYYSEDYESANKYFNSLIVANILLAAILGVIGAVIVPNLDIFLSIPESIQFDVKLTFALVFGSYILNLLTTVFTTSTFVANRTDIQGVRTIIYQLVRLAMIVLFLNFISLRLYWVSLAALIATVIISILNVSLTRVLTPKIRLDLRKYARKDAAFTLAKAGGWMTFTSLSGILMHGLDLTIANLCLGATQMGLLSIGRSFPLQFSSVIQTIAPLFTPVFVALFAKNEIEALVGNVKQSINTMAILFFVPICGFIVYSQEFYSLWQSSLSVQDIDTVVILSTITVVQAYFNATTASMAQLSVVVNKLKLPVFVSFGCGVLNVAIVLLLLNFTALGVYAIVLSSSLIMCLRYILFNSFYAAWCLKKPKTTFLWTTVKTWLSIPVLIGFMWVIKYFLPVSSWGGLILDAVICAAIGYLGMVVVYNRELVVKVYRKIFKRGKE